MSKPDLRRVEDLEGCRRNSRAGTGSVGIVEDLLFAILAVEAGFEVLVPQTFSRPLSGSVDFALKRG